MHMIKTSSGECVLGPVRLSYLTVFKPRLNEMNSQMEYSVVLMIPKLADEAGYLKNPPEHIKALADEIKSVLAEKFGTKIPGNWKNPLRDGDKETNNDGEAKMPGHFFMTAKCKSEYAPLLIDGPKNKVTDGWNSGDYGIVKFKLFAFDQPANKGVAVGLRAIQFLHKGESLGGGEPTDEGFETVATTTQADGYDPRRDPNSPEFDPFF